MQHFDSTNKLDLDSMIKHRNELLRKAFNNIDLDAVIIGDRNQPFIVIKNYGSKPFGVQGYVHNFKYHFKNQAVDGDIIHTIDLNEKKPLNISTFIDIISKSEVRKVYRIVLSNGLQFASHREIQAFDGLKTNYYWSDTDCKYFISYAKAAEVFDKFKHLNPEIIS
jgi:hypothetical protein